MPSFAEQMKQYFKQNAKTKEYCAHSAKVHSVAWNKDGHKLASGSYDQTASVFVLDRDRLVRFLCVGLVFYLPLGKKTTKFSGFSYQVFSIISYQFSLVLIIHLIYYL